MSERINPEKPKQGKFLNTDKYFCLHRDMQDAYLNYRGPKSGSFQRVFKERKRKAAAGESYHNEGHDVELAETARERSQRPDFAWPTKRGEPTLDEELETFKQKVKAIWNG